MDDARGVKTVAMEVGTAVTLAAVGALALWDSARIGIGWSEDGPKSGTFPFWIGLILVAASLGTLAQTVRRDRGQVFVTWPQLRMVLSVLLPTVVYVAAIPFLGIYAASAVLVAYCMVALGGFVWWRAVVAGIVSAGVIFVTFEIWFLVPLPKGPIETLLGL